MEPSRFPGPTGRIDRNPYDDVDTEYTTVSTEAEDGPPLSQGPRDVTKKVRLTRQEASLLSELAERCDGSQSEVLREGLRLQDRMRRRADNMGELIDLIGDEEPEKIRFEMDG